MFVQNFHLQMEVWEKMSLFFETDMSSSVRIDNKSKNILIFGERPTYRLDDTTLTAKAIYPINFTHPNKKSIS